MELPSDEHKRVWLVQAYDDADKLVDAGMGDDPEDAILGVAERLLPPDA